MDSSTITIWISLFLDISTRWSAWLVCIITICFKEIHAFNAHNVDPDQMPCSAAFDLGLHCLPMLLLWDARHK